MKNTLDVLSLTLIACALSLASGGRYIAAFVIYLALMWLYLRLKPPTPPSRFVSEPAPGSPHTTPATTRPRR